MRKLRGKSTRRNYRTGEKTVYPKKIEMRGDFVAGIRVDPTGAQKERTGVRRRREGRKRGKY